MLTHVVLQLDMQAQEVHSKASHRRQPTWATDESATCTIGYKWYLLNTITMTE